MAINSVTSGSAPQTVQQTQQSADSRRVEAQRAAEQAARAEELDRQRQAERTQQERQAQQNQQPAVVNTQGQVTGQVINTVA